MGKSLVEIAGLAYGAGLRDPLAITTAVAVSAAENPSGDPSRLGDLRLQTAKWGPSVGLWQVRSLKAEKGKGTTRDQDRLTDPAANAKAMAEISGGGKNWDAWSVTHPLQDPAGYARYVAARPLATAATTAALAGKGVGVVADEAKKQVDAATATAGVISDAVQTPVRVINWLTEGGTWTRIGYFSVGLLFIVGGGLAVAKKPIGGTAKTAVSLILPTGKAAKAASAVAK